MRVRLVHLDGSLRAQADFLAACGAQAQHVEAQELGRRMRLWTRGRRLRAFVARLEAAGEPPGDGPVASFLGSGDFHHLTAALVARLPGPLTVIHFDNHPDFVRLAMPFHCASWVNRVLALPNVARVVTVGPCADLAMPQRDLGNLAAVADGRLELYPYRHGPSRVWGHFGSGPGHVQQGRLLHWRNVGEEDWSAFWNEVLTRVPARRVYITIDKDVLAPPAAATNWDQGQMPLEDLLAALRIIGRRCEIAGVDVVGDYSPVTGVGAARRLFGWLDHPAGNPDPVLAARCNDSTNVAILHALREVA